MRQRVACGLALAALAAGNASAVSVPARARHGIVATESGIASQVGVDVLADGGNAIDAAVATAFALAAVYPAAGNLGGGGFLLYRPAGGEPVAYDFREMAPARATPTMFLKDGRYDKLRHHKSPVAVGVPGTVAGLHRAWKEHGKLAWRRLVKPAIRLARDGFAVSHELSRSLESILPEMKSSPAAVAQFSHDGAPYQPGELLRQPELALSLERIAEQGPAGFYEGETARLIEQEMTRSGGLITRADLAAYEVKLRTPLRGTYRGYEVIAMPPVSSGGVAILESLNVLEGYDLRSLGFGSAAATHLVAETLRRVFAERARYLGDPDFNPKMPVSRLISKPHAADVRKTIRRRASLSTPTRFEWPRESHETTHLSVMDAERNAVALTYTLEDGYGSKIVVPGAGFLLNNEMGDFNAAPGLTTADGLIGTEPNLAAPGKRMLSSMSPAILTRDGRPFLVVGAAGGRRIISTVLQTILNVVDYGMNVQEAVDAPRIHHQWLPDRLEYERFGLSPDTVALLKARGHRMKEGWPYEARAQAIVFDAASDLLAGAADRREGDSAALGR